MTSSEAPAATARLTAAEVLRSKNSSSRYVYVGQASQHRAVPVLLLTCSSAAHVFTLSPLPLCVCRRSSCCRWSRTRRSCHPGPILWRRSGSSRRLCRRWRPWWRGSRWPGSSQTCRGERLLLCNTIRSLVVNAFILCTFRSPLKRPQTRSTRYSVRRRFATSSF